MFVSWNSPNPFPFFLFFFFFHYLAFSFGLSFLVFDLSFCCLFFCFHLFVLISFIQLSFLVCSSCSFFLWCSFFLSLFLWPCRSPEKRHFRKMSQASMCLGSSAMFVFCFLSMFLDSCRLSCSLCLCFSLFMFHVPFLLFSVFLCHLVCSCSRFLYFFLLIFYLSGLIFLSTFLCTSLPYFLSTSLPIFLSLSLSFLLSFSFLLYVLDPFHFFVFSFVPLYPHALKLCCKSLLVAKWCFLVAGRYLWKHHKRWFGEVGNTNRNKKTHTHTHIVGAVFWSANLFVIMLRRMQFSRYALLCLSLNFVHFPRFWVNKNGVCSRKRGHIIGVLMGKTWPHFALQDININRLKKEIYIYIYIFLYIHTHIPLSPEDLAHYPPIPPKNTELLHHPRES